MLFYSTIQPPTLQLLKDFQDLEGLEDFVLVGGTSLALQIGHRISIDLDLFTFSNEDITKILPKIEHMGEIKIVYKTSKILNLFINEIKVDFVSYKYEFLNPPILRDGLRLASIQDIAAMKLSAITGRGSKKDFIDLFFILNQFTLAQLMEFYNSKFPDGTDLLVIKSLTYFEDAELEPMPQMLKPVKWENVKRKIVSEARKFFT